MKSTSTLAGQRSPAGQPKVDPPARSKSPRPNQNRWAVAGVYIGASVGLLAALVAGMMIGPAGPDWWRVPPEIVNRLFGLGWNTGVSDTQWAIVWKIRMPRVVLGGIVGGTLALAGASYQGVFRNPLVDPFLLGAASGAGLGATLAITIGRANFSTFGHNAIIWTAFAFSVATVVCTYAVGGSFGGSGRGATLVLSGVAVSSFTSAVQTFLMQRHVDRIQEVYSWIMGRLSSATWSDVEMVTPYVVFAALVLIAHRRHLDVFRVGDLEAQSLGMNVARVRLIVVVAATLGTAAVVSVSGLIGFVGLIVPHAVRGVFGASYRRLLPLSALIGASFLILADIPGRVLTSPAETPIGVVTSFLGAPFFIYLLRSRKTL